MQYVERINVFIFLKATFFLLEILYLKFGLPTSMAFMGLLADYFPQPTRTNMLWKYIYIYIYIYKYIILLYIRVCIFIYRSWRNNSIDRTYIIHNTAGKNVFGESKNTSKISEEKHLYKNLVAALKQNFSHHCLCSWGNGGWNNIVELINIVEFFHKENKRVHSLPNHLN